LHQAFFEGEDPLILRAVFFAACASETLSLPKSLQGKAKCALQDIWMAAIETYGIKYEKAVERLMKDREALLAFYDFPPSIGSIYARQTRSRAHSRPSGIERSDQGVASQTRPRSP
jgi:hypothetical protein